MFDQRYSTRGVSDDIDLDVQLCLWGLIDVWKKQSREMDYLQIFELSAIDLKGKLIQKVVHRQE
jgi:hypothetical protein